MTNDSLKKETPPWYDALRRPPGDRGFTDAAARTTLERARAFRTAQTPERRSIRRRFAAVAVAVSAAAALAAVLLVTAGTPPGSQPGTGSAGGGSRASLAVWQDGVKTIEALPGGGLAAGEPAGAWWNLYRPPEELLGRAIRIDAVHEASGAQLVELEETTLGEEHLYDGRFLRVSSRLALPLPGRWTFQVSLDDEAAGSVAMDVPDGSWEPSGTFRSGGFEMTGVPERLAYVGPGFVAGKPNKYMWHFWGPAESLYGPLEIVAVKRGSSEPVPLFRATLAAGELNGADASMPSGLTLPTAGRWRLMAFVDGAPFGSVVVDVTSPPAP